jgi:hypothetical protein
MNDQHELSRRDFMSLALGLGGGVLLPWRSISAAMSSDVPPLLLFDPTRSDACVLASAAARRGTVTQAITGDRVRFANVRLRGAPSTFAGVTGYADFILLSGCAAEAGYRLVKEIRYPITGASVADSATCGALVFWMVMQRHLTPYDQ